MVLITIVTGVYKPTYNWGGTTLYDDDMMICPQAMCLLGLGSENLIKVPTSSDFSVDVAAMQRVAQRLENVQAAMVKRGDPGRNNMIQP